MVAQRLVQLRRVDREQSEHFGEEAPGVDRERDARAAERNDRAADRRPEDARHRAEARVQADRVRKILGPNHLEHERVARGAADRLRDALQDGEHVDLPDRDHVRQREAGEHGGETQLHGLADDCDRAHLVPVEQRADEQAEHGHRQQLHERKRADRDGRMGQLQDEP